MEKPFSGSAAAKIREHRNALADIGRFLEECIPGFADVAEASLAAKVVQGLMIATKALDRAEEYARMAEAWPARTTDLSESSRAAPPREEPEP